MSRFASRGNTKRRLAGLLALLAAATLAVGVLPSAADHGVPDAAPLARGSFTDNVAAKIKVKLDGRRTNVFNLQDASDVVFLEITIHDGARAPWHTHSGPALLVNKGPGTLTSVVGDDCAALRTGRGARRPRPAPIHAAFNDSGQDLVVCTRSFSAWPTGPCFRQHRRQTATFCLEPSHKLPAVKPAIRSPERPTDACRGRPQPSAGLVRSIADCLARLNPVPLKVTWNE
jgi:hypothetical protein